MFTRFWNWTGIGEKKGWDFLQLLISASIPIFIFWGTQYFSRESNEQQQEIATDRYQQEALTKYFEQMSQLLLDKDLQKEESEARTIARARTLSTLRELDEFRKGLLIKFLAEARLISAKTKVISLDDADLFGADLSKANLRDDDLSDADLSKANLRVADLRDADLFGADLRDADLFGADLSGADLSGADLFGANLSEVGLVGADLSGADLSHANLSKAILDDADLFGADLVVADLSHADLDDADLDDADLRGANLYGAENLSNKQIKSACFWEQAIYTDANWNGTEEKWIPEDEKANQKRIEEIKQDKDSDPETPPDCD